MRSNLNARFNSSNISLGSIDTVEIPDEKVVSKDEPSKVSCDDPIHSNHTDSEIREGEEVYAIISYDNELDFKSIACRECSAKSIYESASKETKLLVVIGTVIPSNKSDNKFYLKNMTLLDAYQP